MLLTSIGHDLRTVALGDHHHRAAMALEEVNIRVHTVSRCRAHRAARMTGRRLGRTCVENRVILDVLGQFLATVEQFLHAGVSDVTGHNDRAG